ncbi:hypothetical protein CkaCkLH20_04279 [Colletotrichum karsti]|uniref:Histone chaperone RTT106/FACT complex subunit SPT16-like middle domain-containing protein n=1 Tax=Colletotrichum karsti TaxID=1095194 RepID=A0A9P6ICX3_9PEZI|nr:uncharacterized protein CkaCkLH20_04279 [Colletotrichum karsti]KAF9878241.1 hypothetical protein CkaCkLH20_04279 [Colletotrichum karsti]
MNKLLHKRDIYGSIKVEKGLLEVDEQWKNGSLVRWSYWMLSYDMACANDLEHLREVIKRTTQWGSVLVQHISRWFEDLIIYSSEFDLIRLADTYITMKFPLPQKKNPDSYELRGKSGHVFGQRAGFMMAQKGLPSTYNKDPQNIQIAEGVLATIDTQPEKMKVALDPFMLATDLVDNLVRKGVPFREPHHISGRCLALFEKIDIPMNELSYEQMESVGVRFECFPIMAAGLDSQRLGAVFQSRPDILKGIQKAADTPDRVALFNDIASFVYEQINGPEPASKRRRVDEGPSNGFKATNTNGTSKSSAPKSAGTVNAADEEVLLEIKEISVSVPQRKKYELCFTENHLYARLPGTTAPVEGIIYPWEDIEYAFYLPVPEKTQVQHNYVLFPRGTCLPTKTAPEKEALVFTVPSTPPKQGTIGGPKANAAAAVSDTYRTLFDWALTTHLSSAGNAVEIVAADPSKFHSLVRQPHRPNEKAVHVKAFRGSKDGYLFFLPNGILYGFKKPLVFLPADRIVAVSYTNVLQRTFNMVVEVFAEGDETEEIEFGMLDQEDFAGIDESYVKRHGLQDRSMAEQRKAKMELTENLKVKKGEEASANGDAAGTGLSELAKAHLEAEQNLQDDEDEDEEDYDPGSEGESEGSGSDSDDSDDSEDAEGDGDEDMDDDEDDE